MLFIDADISFDPQQVHDMLAFDQEFVAGMYPLKVIDWGRARDETPDDGRIVPKRARCFMSARPAPARMPSGAAASPRVFIPAAAS